MRTHSFVTLMACALMLVWSGMAAAQATQEHPSTPQAHEQAGQHEGFHMGQGVDKTCRARELLGMNVWNSQNQKLGDIHDLVFDGSSGRLTFAILAHGGALGIGEKFTAVPIDFLSVERDSRRNRNYLVLDINQQQLQNAPSFSRDNWPNFSDQRYVSEMRQFYTGARTASRPGTQR